MRPRLAMLAAVALAAAAVAVAVIRLAGSSPSSYPAADVTLAPRSDSYLGVYEPGAPASFGQVTEFARSIGREPNLAGYFSGWAEPFKTAFASTARRDGAVTLVQIDPTDATVGAIAAGDYDGYLRSYADEVRDFGHPVVLGFGHEMNASWYPWGYGHIPPRVFVAAWRHIVDLFRAQGAGNVTWLWTIQADSPGTGPVRSWWPGSRYVSWIGIDGYYYRPSDTFAGVFGATIRQVRTFTGKPVLLSETGAGPAAGQAAKIGDLFRGMSAYQTLGLVWFDIAQHDGIYHQDWRIEHSAAAVRAFRQGIRAYFPPPGDEYRG
jgi:Glycosyl hydrolase family 26